MNKIVEIAGGFKIIEDDCLGKWQIETQRLDHDLFLPPLACQFIPVDGVAIDCGAMCGDHTIAYARKVGKKGVVVAIEPGIQAYECLCHNAGMFESQIVTINGALSDSLRTNLEHIQNKDNVGGSQVKTLIGEGDKVDTFTLDLLVNDIGLKRLDFIKLDIEGMELKALEGAIEVLNAFKPTLLLEMNSARLAENGANYDDIHAFFDRNGYIFSNPLQPECNALSPQYDIIAKPLLDR